MGCWNETCALTRLPIQAGEPIVALDTVNGPPYKDNSGGCVKTDLLFGLPYAGTYDDYGGIENFENPDFVAFQQAAFEANPYYRKVSYQNSYRGEASMYVVAHPDIWSVSSELFEPIFLMKDQVGILQQDKARNQASDEAGKRRYKDNQEAREKLVTLLNQADFGKTHDSVLATFEEVFDECFGKPYGMLAYQFARQNGLTLGQGHILMHKSAYEAAVKNFSPRKVTVPNGQTKQSMTLRQYLSQTLDALLTSLQESERRFTELTDKLKLDPKSEEALAELNLMQILRKYEVLNREFEALKPLTTPWMDNAAPLISHFWGTRQPQEILQAYGREPLLDFLVFQWARHYMRLDLTGTNGGSQNREVDLLATVYKETLKTVYGGKKIRDFYPYLG